MSERPTSRILIAFYCVLFSLAGQLSAAATLPSGFSETTVASGLSKPTAMAFAPDGRLFVCLQDGELRVIKDGALLDDPFITLTVNSSGERGLLGVAFDPAFASNHFVYVYYTATTPNIHNRVSRFVANGDVASGPEQILLDLEALGASNHNGGAIHFGPDGKLYIATGENAVRDNAKTLNNKLGKILRINPDGSIPDDNPFFDTASGTNRSIWALGLRNPFTFAFQPLTGKMFINDVGEQAWEEINEGVAGSNYGWPDTEGVTSNPLFRSPLHAYNHNGGRCAIAGGAFHSFLRSQFPIQFWNAYFFADLCAGWIRARQPNGTILDFASGITSPVDLQMASDGSLYYLARGSGSNTGIVRRVAYTLAAPKIDLTVNDSDGPLTLTEGNGLHIEFSFAAGSGPPPTAEVYVAVAVGGALLWLDPAQGFKPAVARIYAGPLPTVGPLTVINVPNAGTLADAGYVWLILVDEDNDGVPAGDFSDFVLTIVS